MRKKLPYLAIFIFAIIVFLFCRNFEQELHVDIQHVKLDSIQKIIEIDDSLVIPVLYDTLLVQKFVPIEIRKQQFINQVLPAILIVKFQIENKSKRVRKAIKLIEEGKNLSRRESMFIDSLMVKYQAKNHENLLIRLKLHPTSLVLAQSALESGWGSSRIAIEGNNLFGMRSLSNDPKKLKSGYSKDQRKIFVKKYDNITESIDHYFLTLGRNNAYLNFRNKRYEEVDVFQLIETLNNYSEKGNDYGKLLKKMVEWNNLQQYDNYVIDPKYIKKDGLYKSMKDDFLD